MPRPGRRCSRGSTSTRARGTRRSSAAARPASASRSMRRRAAIDVLLLEQSDFGKGTSSRSTKLVHGGVRYLEQGNISLVMEALKERGILRQNAPHLVSNLPFVVPNYDWWETPFYGIGLKVYNLLAGKYGFGDSSHPLARGDAAAAADDQDRRPARRRRLLRRAVRRCAAADQSRADGGRAGRDAAELRAGDRADQGGRRHRRRRRGARPGDRASSSRRGASRHQRHGPVLRQRAAPGRIRRRRR